MATKPNIGLDKPMFFGRMTEPDHLLTTKQVAEKLNCSLDDALATMRVLRIPYHTEGNAYFWWGPQVEVLVSLARTVDPFLLSPNAGKPSASRLKPIPEAKDE